MLLTMVRHGESESNAKLSESKDSRLTELGRMQAARAGERLAREAKDAAAGGPIDALYCSPQLRALETAAIIARYLGLRPKVWVDLAEHGFSGPEPGLPRREILARFPDFELPDEVDEDGWARHWTEETTEELVRRMAKVAKRAEAWFLEGSYRHVLLVTHGTATTELLRHLLRIDPFSRVRFRHHNGGMSRIEFDESAAVRVHFLNDVSHLAGLPEATVPGQPLRLTTAAGDAIA